MSLVPRTQTRKRGLIARAGSHSPGRRAWQRQVDLGGCWPCLLPGFRLIWVPLSEGGEGGELEAWHLRLPSDFHRQLHPAESKSSVYQTLSWYFHLSHMERNRKLNTNFNPFLLRKSSPCLEPTPLATLTIPFFHKVLYTHGTMDSICTSPKHGQKPLVLDSWSQAPFRKEKPESVK